MHAEWQSVVHNSQLSSVLFQFSDSATVRANQRAEREGCEPWRSWSSVEADSWVQGTKRGTRNSRQRDDVVVVRLHVCMYLHKQTTTVQ